MLGAQASGTQVEALELTVYRNRGRVNVGYPAAVGMPFGMTHIVAELGCFTAYIALQSNCSFDCLANLL
jgi:hypothetical protein